MATLKGVSDYLELTFSKEIKAHHVLPSSEGELSGFPATLHASYVEVLKRQGIESLYSHQQQAFEPISRNQDTLLVSHTASGKTLSFLLPILNEFTRAGAPFGVMLMYPTKALSRDQEGALGKLVTASGATVRRDR